MCTTQKGGSGISRLEAYHSRSRSKKTMRWPRVCSARARARYVVACPLPHDDVIDNPRMVIFNFAPQVKEWTTEIEFSLGLAMLFIYNAWCSCCDRKP